MNFILSDNQVKELETLIFKIRTNSIRSGEIDRFQYLVRKVNYKIDIEFQQFLLTHGYIDIKHFVDDYNNKKNKEFIEGLIKIGLGILAAYALYRLLKEK